eukprot:387405_1
MSEYKAEPVDENAYSVDEPDDEKSPRSQSLELASTIDKKNSIWKDNRMIGQQLSKVLDITSQLEVFNDPRSTLAKQFATTMEGNSRELIATQSTLRQCCQSVMNVLSYKPPEFETEKQKIRWDLIHTFSAQIRKSVIRVQDVGAEWFGYLTILHHGIAYYYQTVANGHGTPDIAIQKFQNAAKEFAEFQAKNAEAFMVVRQKSEEAMNAIEKTFGGGQAIKNAQKKMDAYQEKYAEAMQQLKELEGKKLEEIMPLNLEIAQLKGDLAQYDVQLKYSNNEISNLEKEQKNAAERARQKEKAAESAKNYRKELWTKSSWSWWGWRRKKTDYYKDIHTGEKDRLQGIADRYRNIRKRASNEKEAKYAIRQEANKNSKETKEKIKAKEEAIRKKKQIHDPKIDLQVTVVQTAKKRYDDCVNLIKKAVAKYAVGEHSVGEFLTSTQQLGQESLKALAATKNIEVNVRRLSQIITSKCETVWSIDTYFKRSDVQLEALIEPLKQNKCFTMRDLDFAGEEKEFKQHILPLIEDKMNYSEKRKLIKLCCDKDEVERWKESEKKLGKSNTANLMMEVPSLSLFFPSLHRRLEFAWNMLRIADSSENKNILSILPQEIRALELDDKKKTASGTKQISKLKAIDLGKNKKK